MNHSIELVGKGQNPVLKQDKGYLIGQLLAFVYETSDKTIVISVLILTIWQPRNPLLIRWREVLRKISLAS